MTVCPNRDQIQNTPFWFTGSHFQKKIKLRLIDLTSQVCNQYNSNCISIKTYFLYSSEFYGMLLTAQVSHHLLSVTKPCDVVAYLGWFRYASLGLWHSFGLLFLTTLSQYLKSNRLIFTMDLYFRQHSNLSWLMT